LHNFQLIILLVGTATGWFSVRLAAAIAATFAVSGSGVLGRNRTVFRRPAIQVLFFGFILYAGRQNEQTGFGWSGWQDSAIQHTFANPEWIICSREERLHPESQF